MKKLWNTKVAVVTVVDVELQNNVYKSQKSKEVLRSCRWRRDCQEEYQDIEETWSYLIALQYSDTSSSQTKTSVRYSAWLWRDLLQPVKKHEIL